MPYDAGSSDNETLHELLDAQPITQSRTQPIAQPTMQPGMRLGLVRDVVESRARVRVDGEEHWLEIDASVDPRLLEQAQQRGARVVIEDSVIVGLLMTARTLELDRSGNLHAQVKNFVLEAQEALIKTPHSFLRLRERASELFGDELIVRGRLLARILGKTIRLN